MKIEEQQIHIDATDVNDRELIRIARRGTQVRLFDEGESTPLVSQVEDKLFWAGRHAMSLADHEELRQLNLLEADGTQCAFSSDEARVLADLIRDGLRYKEGVIEKRFPLSFLFNPRPPKYVDRMWTGIVGGYHPEVAEAVLPIVQAFAAQ